jgi:hypothetical protein
VALGSYPPRAPTDPYVLALEHTVPRPADSPSARDPEAIQSSYGDMRWNLDVFHKLPSIESAGRHFASLPRVLRGEFPCFNGTIKALRLPAARPAALRCLRLAVPRLHSFCSLLDGRVRRQRPGVGHPVSPAGMLRGNGRISQVPGEPRLSVCPCSTPTPAGPLAPDQYSAAVWPLVIVRQRLLRKVFRRSIAWLSDSLSTLRSASYLVPRKTRFRPLVRRYRTGFPPARFP